MGIFPRTATKIDESKSQSSKNTYHCSRHQFTPPASSSPAVPDNAGDLDRRFDLMVPEKKIGSCLIHPMKGQLASNINCENIWKVEEFLFTSFFPLKKKNRVELTTLFSALEKTPTQQSSSKINLAGTPIESLIPAPPVTALVPWISAWEELRRPRCDLGHGIGIAYPNGK